MRITVQEAAFDMGAELSGFAQGRAGVGAIVSFTGVVRDTPDDPLIAMEIEHYPAMTSRAIEKIAAEAQTRWNLKDVLVIHRFGRLVPGEVIMMVATQAGHRAEAFDAAEFLMDYLKSRAPFWKREISAGGAAWVDAKEADEQALERW